MAQARQPRRLHERNRVGDRVNLDGLSDCILCACAPPRAPAPGGTGSHLGTAVAQAIAASDSLVEAAGDRLAILKNPSALPLPHIMNFAQDFREAYRPVHRDIKTFMVPGRLSQNFLGTDISGATSDHVASVRIHAIEGLYLKVLAPLGYALVRR